MEEKGREVWFAFYFDKIRNKNNNKNNNKSGDWSDVPGKLTEKETHSGPPKGNDVVTVSEYFANLGQAELLGFKPFYVNNNIMLKITSQRFQCFRKNVYSSLQA